MLRKKRASRLLRDLAYEALGGIAGSYAMKPVTNLLYKYERPDKKEREKPMEAS